MARPMFPTYSVNPSALRDGDTIMLDGETSFILEVLGREKGVAVCAVQTVDGKEWVARVDKPVMRISQVACDWPRTF